MNKTVFASLFSALALTIAFNAPASAQSSTNATLLDCQTELRGGYVGCSLRMPAGYKGKSISAKKLNGESYSQAWRLLDAEDLRDNTKVDLSGTLVLVDVSTSSATRRQNFKRNEIPAIKKLIEAMPEDELVALSVFGADAQTLVPFTKDRVSLLTALDELELTETNTMIRLNLNEAVKLVAAQDSFVMGSIVLVSDGMEEPSDEPLQSKLQLAESVVNAAKENRIKISAMGSFWQGRGSADIAVGRTYLTALTDGSGGEFEAVEFSKRNEYEARIDQLAGKLRSVREESKLVVLRDGEEPQPALVQVVVERPVALGSAQTVEETVSDDFSPDQISPEETVPDEGGAANDGTTTESETAELSGMDQAIALAQTYWYAVAGVAILLALLLFAVLRKSGGDAADEDTDQGDPELDGDFVDDQTIIPAAAEDPAVLAVLVDKASGKHIQISPGRTAIGRGTKNDVVISDNSVSRAHAVVQSDGKGGFTVSDLQSLNGTFVNGNKINEATRVGYGDTIVLGDYNMVLQKS
ncbi:MAG: FHA domain-containing protein [Pseudomonadota bacterium]